MQSKQTTLNVIPKQADKIETLVNENSLLHNKTNHSVFIQPKLTVGAPNDPYEKEADTMADKVMRMPEQNFVQRKCAHCEEEEEKMQLQRKTISENITPIIQAKSEGGAVISNSLSNKISSTLGSGSNMDSNTQSFMSSRFGNDFSHVKIHTDGDAIQMNRELNAKAFTTGSDIYFNEGQYQPNSDSSKHLLAHELTHTVQQGIIRNKIQRIPFSHTDRIHDQLEEDFSSDTGIPRDRASHHSPEYEAWLLQNEEAREMVQMAIDFLNNSANYYQMASVDQTLLDRVLSGWIRMATINSGIIQTRLNNNISVLQSFKTAFNNAVRSLFSRAAALIPNTTVIQLYLSNLYRLPEWSRPDVASFNLTSDTQRRTFIANLTSAFNISNLFQGYSRIDEPALQSILSYLSTIITDSQNIIANSLRNDPTVLDPLKIAYRNAINLLLSRASTDTGISVLQLFMRYRYGSNAFIHEWADQVISGTSVAAPLGTSADPLTNNITFTHNGFEITIEPDGIQASTGATTNNNIQHETSIAHNWVGNNITSFTPPRVPTISIRTNYGPGSSSGSSSGYGRGTTAEDIRLGNTSLGYHEKSHSRDFLRYIQNNPAPVFTGATGMNRRTFTAAVNQYVQAMRQYSIRMNRESELATDCVGSPNIVQYHTAQGTVSSVACP